MPVELQRTLFIGLGGAGIKTILKTKSMFLERFGEVPPCVAFLGIDTDAQVFAASAQMYGVSLDAHEAVAIGVTHAYEWYRVQQEAFSWMPPQNVGVLPYLKNMGAGQLRSSGRFMFESNYHIIENAVRRAFDGITASTIKSTDRWTFDGNFYPQVYVAFSLSGGTGSGIFINMGYLLRDVLKYADLHAYAIGPEVFRDCGLFVGANAYGAMLDMDYIMTEVDDEHPLELQTMNGVKSYGCKPYDFFYLIDNINRYGLVHLREHVYTWLGTSLFYKGVVLQKATLLYMDMLKWRMSRLPEFFSIKDKKRWVCGQGLCEILVDTKNLSDEFSLKAGMQLVRSIIGEDHDYEMTDSAIRWINKNNLCEHEADQLLDSLFDFADLKQSVIASSRGSDAKIESDTWISEGEQEASKAIEANFDERMSVIKKEIASKLSEIIASGDGLNGAKAFVNCLKTAFDIYAGEMREELVTLNKQQSGFTSEIADIIADWPRLFGIGGSKTLLQEAQKLLLTNKIDISRHVKASQFYAEMKEYLSFMEHQLENTLLFFNEIIRMISEMSARLAYKKEDNPFQIDLSDRVHVDGNHQDNTLEKFIASLNCDNVLDLSTLEAREVMEMILAFTSSLDGADFSHVSIEDLIIVMDEGEKMCLFEKAARKSEYFLDSQYHGYPSPQEEWICVSVPEGLYGVLAQDHAFAKAIKSYSHGNGPVYAPSSSSTGIIIYRHKAPYPVFQLESIVRHKRVWEERFGFKSFSFDLAVEEKIKDENFGFLPNQRKVPYLELWVKGLIFGFIRRNGNRYEVQSMSLPYADALDDFWVTLRCPEDGMPTEYRYYACEYLKSNRKELSRRGDLLDRIRRKEHEMRRDALNQLYADVANYSDEEYVREYFTADVLLQDIIDNPIYARTKQLLDDELWYVRERLLDSVK